MFAKPKRFPIRECEDGKWEVLLISDDRWYSQEDQESSPISGERWFVVETKTDAETIARIPVLRYEAEEHTRSGPAFANELESAANVAEKYRIGRYIVGRFRRLANAARQENSPD